MVIFGISLSEENKAFEEFVAETNERIKDNNVVRNPFTGRIIKLDHIPGTYLIQISPLYPNYTPYIWIIGIFLFYFRGPHWLHIPIIILGCLGLFWSRYFYYWMFRLGAKKKGSNSKLSLLSDRKTLEVAFFNNGTE